MKFRIPFVIFINNKVLILKIFYDGICFLINLYLNCCFLREINKVMMNK